jgi:hypothetical protein
MEYQNLSDAELNKLIEDKRSELNSLVERQGIGLNTTPSDELVLKSRELDELLTIAQSRLPKNEH